MTAPLDRLSEKLSEIRVYVEADLLHADSCLCRQCQVLRGLLAVSAASAALVDKGIRSPGVYKALFDAVEALAALSEQA